jgi:hypothetical protein
MWGTGAIGLIPTSSRSVRPRRSFLFGLRMIHGVCLGGQNGGAVTYVAERVSDKRRGYDTGWATDLAHPRHCTVAHGHHCRTHLFRR